MKAIAILKVVFGVSFAIPIIRYLYVYYMLDIVRDIFSKLHEIKERLEKILKRRN